MARVAVCVLLALCAAGARAESGMTPRATSALSAQIGTRVCIMSDATLNVSVSGRWNASVHLFKGVNAWSYFTPAAHNYVQQCTEWLTHAYTSERARPGGTLLPLAADDGPEFWYVGVTVAECTRNVSSLVYELNVLGDASVFADTIACMGMSERALSELWNEWMAIRGASILNVPHVSIFGIIACYAASISAAVLGASFYLTAHRGVTPKNQTISRYAFIACISVAVAYFLLATGNFGYRFVYRMDGRWVSEESYAGGAVTVYAIPLARFISRIIGMTIIVHALMLYVHEGDAFVAMLACASTLLQMLATLILTPSRWIVFFFSWITAAMCFARARARTKKGTRAMPATVVLWLLDALVWCTTDAIHTTPVAASIVAHALVDVASMCAVPLVLRSGGYKRASTVEVQVLEPDE